MIYTSGSTGKPKGAINSHRGIVNRLRWMQDEYRLTPADAVLQKTPFSFDVSVWEFFWPLMTGARLVMARPGGHGDPGYLADAIVANGITVLHFVPSMLRAFLDAPDAARRCRLLHDVMCSGEALPLELCRRVFDALPDARLHNLYGPTEAAVDVSYWACRRAESRPTVPIGRPVANTQLYVLDAHLQPTPIGVPGELFIAGVQVGLGYHRRPGLTAERFVVDKFSTQPGARMYATGDRARWLADGTLEYLGRLDHQIKLRGQRIELEEVEAELARQPGVTGAVASVREDVPGDQRMVAYVTVGSDESRPSVNDLRAGLRRTLPDGMIPSAIIVLERFPLTPNGKLDRRALPAPVALEDERPYTPPRGALEEVIAGVWADVLALPRVSVDRNFFELGGHSLLATQVVARVTRLFRMRVTLRSFFEHPTVREFASVFATTESKPGQAEAVAGALLRLRDMTPDERERLRSVRGA